MRSVQAQSPTIMSAAARLAMLGLVACSGQALAQTFTGSAPPGTPGNPYDWYATRDTGTPCATPGNTIYVNNWSSQWCTSGGAPVWPSGLINLNGFDVSCFQDTNTSGLLNPAGGQLRLGLNKQSFGPVTNAGTILIGRGGGSSILNATTIANSGTLSNPGGGNGSSLGNVTINNTGTITNNGGSYDLAVVAGQPWSGPCTINSTGTIQSVSNGSGALTGWTLNINAGSVFLQHGSSLALPNCSTTSQPGATWTVGGGASTLNIIDGSLQGTFNGSTAGNNGILFNGTISIPENTTFNITGNGIYRWVGDTLNIAPGKTVTNAGRMWSIAPHAHPTNGNFTNTGTFEHSGTIVLNNSTYTNTASGTYNFYDGVFSATGINQIINNGLMQSTANNGGMTFQSVNFSNTGIIRNDTSSGATIGFTSGTSVTSSPAASWIVTGGNNNGFDFIDAHISGTFNGTTVDNNDWRINQSLTVTDNTTFNITGGGITRWVCNSINVAPGKVLRNIARMNHLNGGVYTGSVINDGVFEYYNGGTSFANHTFTNNGTITWYVQDFNNNSGTNSFINNGTINVQPNNFNSNINVPNTNNGLITIGGAAGPAGWGSNFVTPQQGATGIIRLIAPTEPTSILYVPANANISGGTIEGNGAVSIGNLDTANFGNVLLNANNRAAGNGRLQLRGSANLSNDTRTRVRIDNVGANTNIDCWRTFNCNGTLELDFRSGFTPNVGNSWTVVGTQTRTGTFDHVTIVGGNSGIEVSTTYTPTTVVITITDAGCDSIDFNNDTSFFDPQDIDAFLSVYSEGPCVPAVATCNDIDFNNDTSVFDPCDIDAFLLVFSEGPCTPCGV